MTTIDDESGATWRRGGSRMPQHEYNLLTVWNFIESKLELFENYAKADEACRAFRRTADRYHLSDDFHTDPAKWLFDDCSFAEDEDYLVEVFDIQTERTLEQLREEYISRKMSRLHESVSERIVEASSVVSS
jgi:hypothetical protein